MDTATNSALLQEFVMNARQSAATAEVITATPAGLNDALIKATALDEIVLFEGSRDLDPGLFAMFTAGRRVILMPDHDQWKKTRTGVTEAFCGVASTGSVCVSVGTGTNAFMGMLTRRHIVVLDARTIVPRPRDVLSEKYLDGKGLHRSFSFITGPSATADMGPLVRGVHGPGEIHIIVLE